MKEITQVLVTAVGLALLLPPLTVVAFYTDLGILFVGALFVLVSLSVVFLDQFAGDDDAEGEPLPEERP